MDIQWFLVLVMGAVLIGLITRLAAERSKDSLDFNWAIGFGVFYLVIGMCFAAILYGRYWPIACYALFRLCFMTFHWREALAVYRSAQSAWVEATCMMVLVSIIMLLAADFNLASGVILLLIMRPTSRYLRSRDITLAYYFRPDTQYSLR